MIHLEHIHFLRDDRTILDDVHLHIHAGEHWVILGRNGSGKTTILEMINGFLFPTSGKVTVLGNVYGQCDVREVRKKIGYVSQSLFEKLIPRDPVWEIVVTGHYGFLRMYELIPQEVKQKAEDILDQLRILHLKDQPIGVISQGERKKVMLARALMSEPDILILDEPCSGLDLFEREQLLSSIQQLGHRVRSMVYVTHHMEEVIPIFTHAAIIEEGKVIASGSKTEVITVDNIHTAFKTKVEMDWEYGRPWLQVKHELR